MNTASSGSHYRPNVWLVSMVLTRLLIELQQMATEDGIEGSLHVTYARKFFDLLA